MQYLRLSASDRRSFGDNKITHQLLNLQYSIDNATDRERAWNGNVTMQYGRTLRNNGTIDSADTGTVSYSANLGYRHVNLFDISHLNFTSQLRMLSSEFRSEDPFEPDISTDRSRLDSSWRNQLDYSIGLLQIRADADLRDIDGHLTAFFSLRVRRFFGVR